MGVMKLTLLAHSRNFDLVAGFTASLQVCDCRDIQVRFTGSI